MASHLDTASARDMVEALIAGARDPHVLAGLARGRMRARHARNRAGSICKRSPYLRAALGAATRYRDPGPGNHATRTDKDRKTRGHVCQLEALGY